MMRARADQRPVLQRMGGTFQRLLARLGIPTDDGYLTTRTSSRYLGLLAGGHDDRDLQVSQDPGGGGTDEQAAGRGEPTGA
ncbi:MAG: hypothetical protein QOJ95_993, partial [Mycobacterium sp.]|nr:hypothetical protein [Mycobacterium sp.]